MAWNGYPRHFRRNIIRNLDQNRHTNPTNLNEQQLAEKDDVPAIWLRILYIGPQCESLVKKCISKLKRCMKDKNIRFVVMYDAKKMAFFCSNKDNTPDSLHSNVIHEFSCPGGRAKYVGKIERCFYTRNVGHAFDDNSAVFKHLRNCVRISNSQLTFIHYH